MKSQYKIPLQDSMTGMLMGKDLRIWLEILKKEILKTQLQTIPQRIKKRITEKANMVSQNISGDLKAKKIHKGG